MSFETRVTAALVRVAAEINTLRTENQGAELLAKIDEGVGSPNWKLESSGGGVTYGETIVIPEVDVQ